MKKNEIQVGTQYAVSRGDWEFDTGRADRVRVTSTDGKVDVGWRGKSQSATVVEYLNKDGSVLQRTWADGTVKDHVVTIPNRQIREEWATYNARWLRIRAERRASANATSIAQDARARSLLDIIPWLRHNDIDDTSAYVSNPEARRLLQLHVPDIFVLDDAEEMTQRVQCPLATSMQDYVLSDAPFKIKAADLLVILR